MLFLLIILIFFLLQDNANYFSYQQSLIHLPEYHVYYYVFDMYASTIIFVFIIIIIIHLFSIVGIFFITFFCLFVRVPSCSLSLKKHTGSFFFVEFSYNSLCFVTRKITSKLIKKPSNFFYCVDIFI